MNRWIGPGAVVAVLAVATTASALAGPPPLPETPFAATETRSSVVCPGFASATGAVRVAATATGPGLRTAPVTDPGKATDASGLHVVDAPGAPVRVSALMPAPFGATTVVAAATGPDRGLSAAACLAPATDHWFAGADIRTIAQSEVVVANLDGSQASVDVLAYGADGRITAPRGVLVDGNAVETISLGGLDRVPGPITLRVSSGDGRVAAFVRQRTWQLDVPLGADWLPATVAPATDLVVPGIPSGEGTRSLVLTNPGDRTATVAVSSLTTDGPADLVGVEQVEVPPETTRTVDLQAGLDARPAALRITATQPVAAAVWLDTGGGDARRDPAYTAALPPLPQDSVWPVALGRGAATVLQLANPGASDAVVTLATGTGAEPGAPTDVTVPAGAILEVPLPKAAATLLRVQTAAGDLRGAIVSTEKLGKVRGLAVLDLAAGGNRTEVPVVFDPHAGS